MTEHEKDCLSLTRKKQQMLHPVPDTTCETHFHVLLFPFQQNHSKGKMQQQRKVPDLCCQSWHSPGSPGNYLASDANPVLHHIPSANCSTLYLPHMLHHSNQRFSMKFIIPFCFSFLINPSPFHIFLIFSEVIAILLQVLANSSNFTAISGNEMTQAKE